MNKIFKKGITGVYTVGEKIKSLNETDLINLAKSFNDEIQTYSIKEINRPMASSNYYELIFSTNRLNMKALINSHYPFMCFVDKGKSSWMNLHFLNVEEALINYFKMKGFTVLTKDYLENDVDKEELRLLSDIELKQIEYWKTKRRGDIIFNGYD